MMRSLSSCLDATRMWRSTERVSLEKKPSMRLSQEPWVGVKVNSKDFAHRTLRQMRKARMSLRRSVLAGMTGEEPGRPQFMGIAQVLRFPARQRHQPGLGFQRDRRLPTG